jgi:hypothetical protein
MVWRAPRLAVLQRISRRRHVCHDAGSRGRVCMTCMPELMSGGQRSSQPKKCTPPRNWRARRRRATQRTAGRRPGTRPAFH